jgi:hypothetical protein
MARDIPHLPRDGDPDPLADQMADRKSLTYRRREAIRDILRLMGCNHPRNAYCDHIHALGIFGQTMAASTADVLLAGIRNLPRPLRYPDVVKLAEEGLKMNVWISDSDERRS